MECNMCNGTGFVYNSSGTRGVKRCCECGGTGTVNYDTTTVGASDFVYFLDDCGPKPTVKKIETLADTVDYMNSSDYKMRFVGEYYQTAIRYDKLHKMLVDLESGKVNFRPESPIQTLKNQLEYMSKYLYCLEVRAEAEKIPLDAFAP